MPQTDRITTLTEFKFPLDIDFSELKLYGDSERAISEMGGNSGCASQCTWLETRLLGEDRRETRDGAAGFWYGALYTIYPQY